jgi:hypothetical protein
MLFRVLCGREIIFIFIRLFLHSEPRESSRVSRVEAEESSRVESSRVESSRVEPSRAESSRVEPMSDSVIRGIDLVQGLLPEAYIASLRSISSGLSREAIVKTFLFFYPAKKISCVSPRMDKYDILVTRR